MVCCILPVVLQAQSEYLNKVKQRLDKTITDTERVDVLNELAFLYLNFSAKEARVYGEQAFAIAQKIGDKRRIATAVNRIGTSYWGTSDYDSAMRQFRQSLLMAEELQDKELIARNIANIGLVYSGLNDYKQSLKYLHRALYMFNSLQIRERIATLNYNISDVYTRQGIVDSATYYTERAIPMIKRERPALLSLLYVHKAVLALRRQEIDKATVWIDSAFKQLNIYENIFARSYAHCLRADVLIEAKQYEQAEINARKALALGLQAASKERIAQAYRVLSRALYEQHKYKAAADNMLLYVSYKDSVHSDLAHNAMQIFEYERKEGELSLMASRQKEQEHRFAVQTKIQTNVIIFFAIMLIMASSASLMIWLSQRQVKSQKHALEVSLRQLEEQNHTIEHQNRTKDKIFSIIGHDLRTPINGLATLLELAAGGNVSQEDMSLLSMHLRQSVKGLQLMLDNLLRWANTQLQGDKAFPQIFSVDEVADEHMLLFADTARLKQITMENKISKNINVFADKDHLRIILRNLISNAIKFTQPGGKVSVEAHTEGDYAVISVIDTGVGMSDTQLNKLFDKNTHMTTYGTGGEKGTGLGLQLSYEIAQKNRGSISVFSSLGKGTTFIVRLPLAKQA
jgi:signal transduction histidine kinase